MSAAAVPIAAPRRGARATNPLPQDERERNDLAQLVAAAVEVGLRGAPLAGGDVTVKDRLLIILGLAALAAVVGLSVALAFTLWGPG